MAEYSEEFIRKNDVYNLKNALISVIKGEMGKRDEIEAFIYSRAAESALNMIERGVREIPAVDAAPVVHAQWKDDTCTNCGYGVQPWNNTEYCPKCGAKMDLER